MLRDAGVIDAASLYLKKRCTVADVNPQINDATDDFWNRVFDDIEDMTLSSSAYFHRDASGGDVKQFYICPMLQKNTALSLTR